ncbi:MAG: hypothetical protein QF535_05975 [Anaerolineales bacterium]|nr:hypothetical protein [Anaerolineales bacterium]
MKKVGGMLVLAMVLAVSFLPLASAEKGVGLSWSDEAVSVQEGEETCVMYGVYNPFEEDAVVKLFLIGEAKNFVASQSSEKMFIRSGTSHARSQLVEICFEIEQIYEEDCLVGSMMCEQACRGEPTKFKSEVLAAGVSETTSEKSAVGSATEFGVAAPLDITVECTPYPRDLRVAYYSSAIIALGIASLVFYKKFLKKKKVAGDGFAG